MSHDGTCRHVVRGAEQETEAGGGWVWETPRWTELRVRKGGGEGVKIIGAATIIDGGR